VTSATPVSGRGLLLRVCWLFIFKVTEPSSIPYTTHSGRKRSGTVAGSSHRSLMRKAEGKTNDIARRAGKHSTRRNRLREPRQGRRRVKDQQDPPPSRIPDL